MGKKGHKKPQINKITSSKLYSDCLDSRSIKIVFPLHTNIHIVTCNINEFNATLLVAEMNMLGC